MIRLWKAGHKVIDRYEAEGAASLNPKERGRASGDGRSLSAVQEADIRKLICDKRLEQLKMEFALWTRGAVQELMVRECGVELKIRAVGNYLKRRGFSPQKPIRRAYEQKPEAVRAWLDEACPAIEAQARAEGGEIHWGDETAVVNTDVRGRSYAPKGETPVTCAPGSRQKLSMISTVTNQGKARFMIIDDTFGSERLIEFLEALIKDIDRKIFLIVDNLRAHHSRVVKAWLEPRKDRIEIFCLPSYSPGLNPDERLNADLRHAIGSTVPVKTRARLRQATENHMSKLVANPERVRAFFNDPRCQYAE